ncbi:hypothetical protein N7457_007992 [Penicillium paradoxum]|uniref:uncharacterized protein n=1 Tax=Penicillium paradoxum TaxID=176176 RepID=UPI002549A810|nr:uncharacterized protein N7457_007992 [Penicillium paradoxum]KAJ5773096.1 hypothetical protein N7457_007992 [Penicillium paradoxum]
MGSDSDNNRQTSAVEGDTSATPTPANDVGSPAGQGWGDRLWKGGMNEGPGHATAPNPRATMGEFLGLYDQKSRAEQKYLHRETLADPNVRATTEQGEPTCVTEDHSFMGHKAGDPDTLPGWNTFKKFIAP